jgi:hypothetical protein
MDNRLVTGTLIASAAVSLILFACHAFEVRLLKQRFRQEVGQEAPKEFTPDHGVKITFVWGAKLNITTIYPTSISLYLAVLMIVIWELPGRIKSVRQARLGENSREFPPRNGSAVPESRRADDGQS